MLHHDVVINFGLTGIYTLCFKKASCRTFAITSTILLLTDVENVFSLLETEMNYLHYDTDVTLYCSNL